MRFSSFTYLVRQGLHSMKANKLMTFASMGVLTACMVLIGVAYLLGANVDAMVDYIGDQNEMVVYLQQGLTDDQVAQADAAIRAVPGVAAVSYVSPEDVLDYYSDRLDSYANLKEAFADDNPFSANYRVTVEDVAQMESIRDQMRTVEGVDDVIAPTELYKTFLSVQKAVNYASYGLVLVLAIVSVVVVNNTIRITLFARRKEIGIMKLVGATNGFIRFPFFVEGVASGFISALLASAVVCGGYYGVCYWYSNNPNIISNLFGNQLVPLSQVWYIVLLTFLALGFVLCGVGTATSIRKHLDV